jgi:hypothetical protein
MYTAALTLSRPPLHLILTLKNQPFFAICLLDMMQFMQAILTKHAFASSSSDGVTILPGHDKIPALPSHSVQELLTAQMLIAALKLTDKHRWDTTRFARWTAAEQALVDSKGPTAEVCLIKADCPFATHLEHHWNTQSKPIGTMHMASKSFSNSLLPEVRTEVAPYSQGDGEVADSISHGGLPGPAQGSATKARGEALLHYLEADLQAGDLSLWSMCCNSCDGNKESMDVSFSHSQEPTLTAGPTLACSNSDESDIGMDILDCTICDKPDKTNVMEHPPTLQASQQHSRRIFSLNRHAWKWKAVNGVIVEQIARKAMLSFGMPATQVQRLCMTLATIWGMSFAILAGYVLEMGHACLC